MLDEDKSGAAQASESLYAWWMNAIPSFFGADAAKTPDSAADAPASSPALGPVNEAVEMARRLLTPLYQAFLQSLLAHPQPEKAFGTVLEQARTRFRDYSATLAGFRQLMPPLPGLPGLGGNAMWDPLTAFGDAMKPLSLNVERAYGGLADAFGLAQTRELQQAMRELMASALARRKAQAEYLAIAAAALASGVDGTFARLREMGQRGESVDSVLALLRVWARSSDEAVHAAMQSDDALDVSARLLRATTHSRRQLQRVVGVVSASLNVPTRAELDDAYREIQDLKREMRRMRKGGPQAGAVAVADGEAPDAPKKAARRRTPVAKKAAGSRRAAA
jgi:hypothetical protein